MPTPYSPHPQKTGSLWHPAIADAERSTIQLTLTERVSLDYRFDLAAAVAPSAGVSESRPALAILSDALKM
jgi:hypothetical protein